eukprot:gnl/MRDRNA2_/MRDRNA2_110593_c0_seq1.p1 gnl/MRDRNA2_/MRDRNA2_110593_c0~~gnl/MRDRNA2_/MRDRNA2_110593_c0_seq1.p1  ORF type:complete len:688 (-),score=187.95 gnl/MRDRNA2_/MRDRNA2_110593_c0_seq1:73-1863(-)
MDTVPAAAIPHSPPRTPRPFPPAPLSPSPGSATVSEFRERQTDRMQEDPKYRGSYPQAGTYHLSSMSMLPGDELGQALDRTSLLPLCVENSSSSQGELQESKPKAVDHVASGISTSSKDHLEGQVAELSRRFSARGRTCERLRREVEEYACVLENCREEVATLTEKNEAKFTEEVATLKMKNTSTEVATSGTERPNQMALSEQCFLTNENAALKLSLSEMRDARNAAMSDASAAEAHAQSMHAELVRVLRTRDKGVKAHVSEGEELRRERDRAIADARKIRAELKQEFMEQQHRALEKARKDAFSEVQEVVLRLRASEMEETRLAESFSKHEQEQQRLEAMNGSNAPRLNVQHVREEIRAQVDYKAQLDVQRVREEMRRAQAEHKAQLEAQETNSRGALVKTRAELDEEKQRNRSPLECDKLFLDVQRLREEMMKAQVEHESQMQARDAKAKAELDKEKHVRIQLHSELQAHLHLVEQVKGERSQLDLLTRELQQAKKELQIERAKPTAPAGMTFEPDQAWQRKIELAQARAELAQARDELQMESAKVKIQAQSHHAELQQIHNDFHNYRLEVREAACPSAYTVALDGTKSKDDEM